MLKLPPISDPDRYVGLFVYDFKTHVSVGYTADEIRILRTSEKHSQGQAFEIYRANEVGGFELRGASTERLNARESICFLRNHHSDARADYDQLVALAKAHPLQVATELMLTKMHDWQPQHVTALTYPAIAANAISGWLSDRQFTGGDELACGIDRSRELYREGVLRIASIELPTQIDYTSRSAEEVLRRVDELVQR